MKKTRISKDRRKKEQDLTESNVYKRFLVLVGLARVVNAHLT